MWVAGEEKEGRDELLVDITMIGGIHSVIDPDCQD